jgi:hypothetical protein
MENEKVETTESKIRMKRNGWAHKYLVAIKSDKRNSRSLVWLEENLYADAKISQVHGHVLGMAWGLAKAGYAVRGKNKSGGQTLELTELGKKAIQQLKQ